MTKKTTAKKAVPKKAVRRKVASKNSDPTVMTKAEMIEHYGGSAEATLRRTFQFRAKSGREDAAAVLADLVEHLTDVYLQAVSPNRGDAEEVEEELEYPLGKLDEYGVSVDFDKLTDSVKRHLAIRG